jgi:hypothetical protein
LTINEDYTGVASEGRSANQNQAPRV